MTTINYHDWEKTLDAALEMRKKNGKGKTDSGNRNNGGVPTDPPRRKGKRSKPA